MKIRETLWDNEGITHPMCISLYPNHIGWIWAFILIWTLWIGAGVAAYQASEWDYKHHRSYPSRRHILY